MRHLLVLILLAGCGKVTSGAGPDGGTSDGPAAISPGSFVWQRNLYGSFPDAVAVVGDQVYLGASQFSALDLGTGIMVPAGGSDLMYARYTTDGVLESVWRHGAASNEDTIGFSIDPSGNAMVGGLYDGAGTANVGGVDLPPVPQVSNPNFEGVAASYSDTGSLRWQMPLTGTTQLFPRSASTSSTGLTAVTGSFAGTLSLEQRISAGGNDVFYAVFDAMGHLAALQTFGGAGEDAGDEVIFDPLDTVILVGTFTGKVSFGNFPLDAGVASQLFVARLSPQGVPMWAIQSAGTGPVAGASAATTPAGDIVVAVDYRGTFKLAGGDTVTAVGMDDVALVGVSSSGSVAWTRSFGGAGSDLPRSVAVGRNGEIAVTGEFEGQVGFGGDLFTSLGGRDAFVAKYTAGGVHLWSHAAGSAGVDRGLGVAVDATGAVYDSISFHNAIDFGGGPITAPNSDYGGVLIKYSP